MGKTLDVTKYRSIRSRAFVSGIIVYICAGLIFAWSIFVTPLEEAFGWDRSQTSNVFTISIITMSTGCMVGSKIIKRFSSKVAISLGALSMCLGLILSSNISSIWGLYICYGVFCGLGAGLAYNATISTIQRWFPDKVGLVSGALLMCYSMGSMILSTVSSWLIVTVGWRWTFRLIGIVFGCIIALFAQFIFMPSQEQYDYIVEDTAGQAESGRKKVVVQEEPGIEVDMKGMFRRKSWWLYFTWCVLVTAVGLGGIGHAATISYEISDSLVMATFVTSMVSICNGVGRLIFGAVYDRVARRKVMRFINCIYIAAPLIICAAMLTHSVPLVILGCPLIGFAYGGTAITNSLIIRKFYGNKYYAENFGVLNFSGALSAFIGPSVVGLIQVSTGTYATVMMYFVALAVVSFVIQHFIKKA